MSLRTKIIGALLGALVLLCISCLAFFIQVIRPSFIAIEEKEAVKDLHRVVSAIHNEIDFLTSLNHDWAAWDATYEFMHSLSDEYIEENLPDSSFTDNNLNLISFYDVDGRLVWGKFYDIESEQYIRIEEFSGERLPVDHTILRFDFHRNPLDKVDIKGIWMTAEYGPMMISSRPILTNENEGPVRGTLIMGRFLNSSAVARLNRLTKINFAMFPLKTNSLPQRMKPVLNRISPEEPYFIDRINDSRLEIYTAIPDIEGDSGVVIKVDIIREIFQKSQAVMNYAIIVFSLMIITTFLLLSVVMQKIVITPVAALTQHILRIAETGNLASHIQVPSNDEIGILTKECNAMVGKLHVAKHRLQEQSFQQGMAELASGILHNVRNSLHKMFSNCEEIRMTIDRIPVERLVMARQELKNDIETGAKKTDVIHFLDTTNTTLLHFISKTKEQLNRNHPLVEEIEKTLKSYEKWAFGEKVIEKIQPGPIIREAYQLINKKYREKITLTISPEVDDVGYVDSNRVILIQIIINLFTNAIDSIRQMEEMKGEIRVEAQILDHEERKAVEIQFCDNGAGMKREILPHIFERGFSTKQGDNIGLGLHWCFNAIEALNGSISAESDGEGLGACFYLVLPMSEIEEAEPN